MAVLNIGVLGLGTVGSGTVNVLARNREEIASRAGREIKVRRACVRDVTHTRNCPLDGVVIGDDPFAIVNDDAIDVVVELIGGVDVAYEVILEAIENGKHVVTANKALIALHGNEIMAKACQRGVIVAFESAVAGGIPIVKVIREGLSANRIDSIIGIINGTDNFILSAMHEQRHGFDEILAKAQHLGYAEADPTMDVDGLDAAHKLTILASLAFGIPLQYAKVNVEGITGVAPEDIAFAEKFEYRIKHLGIAKRRKEGIELRVHPTLIPEKHLLAAVNGVMNAVLITADAVGTTMYYGSGAGAEPTASAVIADLIDVVRALPIDPQDRGQHFKLPSYATHNASVLAAGDTETAFYLRLAADDRPGVLAQITTILAEAGISIEAVFQPELLPEEAASACLILITHRVREAQIMSAIVGIENLAVVQGKVTRIRLEYLK